MTGPDLTRLSIHKALLYCMWSGRWQQKGKAILCNQHTLCLPIYMCHRISVTVSAFLCLLVCLLKKCHTRIIVCLCFQDNYWENSFQAEATAVKLVHHLIEPHTMFHNTTQHLSSHQVQQTHATSQCRRRRRHSFFSASIKMRAEFHLFFFSEFLLRYLESKQIWDGYHLLAVYSTVGKYVTAVATIKCDKRLVLNVGLWLELLCCCLDTELLIKVCTIEVFFLSWWYMTVRNGTYERYTWCHTYNLVWDPFLYFSWWRTKRVSSLQ